MLPTLFAKKDIDDTIRQVEDKVLVLRFGRQSDSSCLQIDDIVSRYLFIFYTLAV